jgi:hypothetical protein
MWLSSIFEASLEGLVTLIRPRFTVLVISGILLAFRAEAARLGVRVNGNNQITGILSGTFNGRTYDGDLADQEDVGSFAFYGGIFTVVDFYNEALTLLLLDSVLANNVFSPQQQNLWVDSGSGRRPRL